MSPRTLSTSATRHSTSRNTGAFPSRLPSPATDEPCSGPLARSRFYRVIADEAQYIRNRSTKASLSLAHVRAKLRWMLTGTPVTNTLFVALVLAISTAHFVL
jgi:SNF2 family DNA or RNA helicase